MNKSFRYRSAKDGRFVSAKVAKRRPATTIAETVKKAGKKNVKKCDHKGQSNAKHKGAYGKRICPDCKDQLPRSGGTVKRRDNAC